MGIVWVFARTGSAFTALLAISALSGSAQAQTPDISGTYWATEYRAKIQLVGGGDLPLTPKGKAEYDKNMAGLKDGSITDTARKFCVPDGLPRVLATPYPFEIIQAPPGQVTIIHELNHQVRVVAMNKPMPTSREQTVFPFYNGHSIGHFEGDTLVIHTGGFNEKTFLDATGAPHTDEMTTMERIQPERARGRHHHSRSSILHPRLAGALRLQIAQRYPPRRLRLRRTPSRPVVGGGRSPAVTRG